MSLLVHPVANLFPMISEAEFLQLREDIRVHGLREPLWVWRDTEHGKEYLIDGRNRRRACLDLGIEPAVRYWNGAGSLVEFAMSLNFHRRMLSASQRAMVAAKSLPLLEAEAKKRQGARTDLGAKLPTSGKGRAAEQASRSANVSRRSVQDAKKVIDKTHRKITRAVEKGTVAVADAVKIADLPEAQQLEALRRVEAKAAKTLAEVVKKDDTEAALKKGTASLRKARGLFDKLEGKAARAVVAAIDRALTLAADLC